MAQDPGSFPQAPHHAKDPGKSNAGLQIVVVVVLALVVLVVLAALLLLGGAGFVIWHSSPP